MPKKKPQKGAPEMHSDLKGFDIKINEFGELVTNFEIERLNTFLNEHLADKKLTDLHSPIDEEE